MQKLFSTNTRFYPFLLLLSISGFLLTYLFSNLNPDPFFTFYSLISFILCTWFCQEIIAELYKKPLPDIRIILFLFLFLSPILQYYQYLSSYEYLSILFYLFIFYNLLIYLKKNETVNFIFIGLGFILAAWFYPYSLFITLIPLLYLIFKSSLAKKLILILALTSLVVLQQFNYVNYDFLFSWDLDNYFNSKSNSVSYNVVNIIFAFYPIFHPLFFAGAIVTIPFIRQNDFEETISKLILSSLLLYILFVAGLPFQHFNMLILAFPLVIIFLFPAIYRVINLTEYFRPRLLKFIPYAAVIVQLLLLLLLILGYFPKFFNN